MVDDNKIHRRPINNNERFVWKSKTMSEKSPDNNFTAAMGFVFQVWDVFACRLTRTCRDRCERILSGCLCTICQINWTKSRSTICLHEILANGQPELAWAQPATDYINSLGNVFLHNRTHSGFDSTNVEMYILQPSATIIFSTWFFFNPWSISFFYYYHFRK